MNIYIERRTKNDHSYLALVCERDGQSRVITFERMTIYWLAGLPVHQVDALKIGERIFLGGKNAR